MQHSPGDHGRGAAVCKETEPGPCVKPNKRYFSWCIVSRSIVKNCCLRKTWKTGVTKQVCFSEGIVFGGAVQALCRTGCWEQVGVMQCNMQCKLCAHYNLPLESTAHCDPWLGFHIKWSLLVNANDAAMLSLAWCLTACWLMLLTGSGAEVIYLSLWQREEQS